MRKRWPWLLGAAAILAALGLQLTNPQRTNPPVLPGHDMMATNPPPAPIRDLIRQACYNCHSYETKWPWYAHVAPVSWMIVDHVNTARDRMNFSEWPHDQPSRVRKRWRRVADMVSSGEMPLPSYTWMHADARLTPAQRTALADWAEKTGNAQ